MEVLESHGDKSMFCRSLQIVGENFTVNEHVQRQLISYYADMTPCNEKINPMNTAWVSFPFPCRIHKVLTISWTGPFVLDNPAPTAPSPPPFHSCLLPQARKAYPKRRTRSPNLRIRVYQNLAHTHTHTHTHTHAHIHTRTRTRKLTHQVQMRAFSKSKREKQILNGS